MTTPAIQQTTNLDTDIWFRLRSDQDARPRSTLRPERSAYFLSY